MEELHNKNNTNRTEIIKVRVTKKEKELIKERVKYLGINSMSIYLRKVAIDTNVYNIDLAPLLGVKSELNKIGNNINQLVRKANISDKNDLKNDVEELKKYYSELKEKSKILDEFVTKIKSTGKRKWQ